jgi:hypothetical protein
MDVGYPLGSDLWKLCFPGENPSDYRSIEHRFATAIEQKERKPLETLYDRLIMADYFVAGKLREIDNCYLRFLNSFPESHFVTFNYDSLVEILLFHLRRWCPRDGYGVEVNVEYEYQPSDYVEKPSSQLVLHLHGSLCIFTERARTTRTKADAMDMLELREHPVFHFAPEEITFRFPPFNSVWPRLSGYEFLHERVIAPVPNKAEGLNKAFIQDVYTRAKELLSSSERLIAIGYRFNENDEESYGPLLETFRLNKHACGIIVSPEASKITGRLTSNYRDIRWIPKRLTFQEWAYQNFSIE